MCVLAPDRLRTNLNHTTWLGFTSRGPDILESIHEPDYIRAVQNAHSSGKNFLDRRDTLATHDVYQQALLSASAGCDAIDAIMKGRIKRAFCAIRPPGHHANSIRAMGYCVFNNVVIAARYAQQKHSLERVIIIDWDLDPGNGTQEIFWQDPTVLTLSFHQADLYPAAGDQSLIGAGDGKGFNRNVQFPPGTRGKDYLHTFAYVLRDVIARFQPDLAIIAAGFDAHECDPQSKLGIHESDFGKMTQLVLEITTPHPRGRTISLLEGGYNTTALQRSVIEHTRAMDSPRVPAMSTH